MSHRSMNNPYIRFSPGEEPEVFGDSKWAHLVKKQNKSFTSESLFSRCITEDLMGHNRPAIKQYHVKNSLRTEPVKEVYSTDKEDEDVDYEED